MKKKSYFFILIQIFVLNLFGQSIETPSILSEDVKQLEFKVLKLLKKSVCYKSSEKYTFRHIFLMHSSVPVIDKEDFINSTFIEKLRFGYYSDKKNRKKKTKTLLKTITIICNTRDTMAGIAYFLNNTDKIYCDVSEKNGLYGYNHLLKKMYSNNMKCLYTLQNTSPFIFFGVNNTGVLVFHAKLEKTETYRPREYFSESWEEFQKCGKF